jgi:hypothetical protein
MMNCLLVERRKQQIIGKMWNLLFLRKSSSNKGVFLPRFVDRSSLQPAQGPSVFPFVNTSTLCGFANSTTTAS